MYRSNRGSGNGFILLEAMLASFLLGLAVFALCGINSRAMIESREIDMSEVAIQVLDKQMTLIEVMGIDDFIDAGVLEGVNEDFNTPFKWRVSLSEEDVGSLYLVEMTVFWLSGKNPRSVSASTMFNGESIQMIGGI